MAHQQNPHTHTILIKLTDLYIFLSFIIEKPQLCAHTHAHTYIHKHIFFGYKEDIFVSLGIWNLFYVTV